jgi:hypothetical protein
LNWKERRRQQPQKNAYETIHIPDALGCPELALSGEVLGALKNIPKVEHHKTKRVFPDVKGKCINCGGTDHQTHVFYYLPSDHCESTVIKDKSPDPNGLGCDIIMSINDPNFVFIFFELFNEHLAQGNLKKENFAQFLKGKIAKSHKTGNYSELVDNCEEWMYLKNKQTHPAEYPLSFCNV